MHLAKALTALLLFVAASAVAQPTQSDAAVGERIARPQDPRLASDPAAHVVLRRALQKSDDTRFTVRSHAAVLRGGALRMSTLSQYWTGAMWEDGGQVIYTHNSDGSLAQETWQWWTGSTWEDEYRIVYTYADGDLVEELNQERTGPDWTTVARMIYTYTDGNATEWREQIWMGSWVDYRRVLLTYEGNLYISALMQDRESGEWEDVYRYAFAYTEADRFAEIVEEAWYGSDWENSYREVYEYDAEGQLNALTAQGWSGTWEDAYRERYTYIDGALVQALSQVAYEGPWEDAYRITYTNDAGGNALEELGEYAEGAVWVKTQRDLHTYAATTAGETGAPTAERFALSVYPNPAHGAAQATFVLGAADTVDWALYDVMGRRVATGAPQAYGPGVQSVQLPLSGVPAGAYILQVRGAEITATQRLTVVR